MILQQFIYPTKLISCVQTFYSYLSHSINFITPADVTTQKCIYNNSHKFLDLISIFYRQSKNLHLIQEVEMMKAQFISFVIYWIWEV